jgi:putative spermidine/putrescine transport system substrate-binding protein
VGAATTVVALAACSAPGGGPAPEATGVAPLNPSSPVVINVLDVAGNLQLTQGMIDEFKAQHPDVVSDITYQRATTPELAPKIKAQQDAGRVEIDLVLTGVDGLAAGVDQGLWVELLPTYQDRLSAMDNYLDGAAAMQELAQNQGVAITYYPSGPLIEYLPANVPNPPTSAEELLEWAKANPGKFQYARPSNSGPGRTFLMGLPYLLGDSDPKDPVNGWDKTWAYLKELDQYVDYYPTGTGVTMSNLGQGAVSLIVSTTGWDINPRALGTVPKEAEIGTLEGFHWVTDAHYAVIPKGVSLDKQAAILQLIAWILTPGQQAKAYDNGYFYPGPAIKDVPLSLAPQASRDTIANFGREEYEDLIANNPLEVPLGASALVAAFERWDQEIGAGKTRNPS